MNFIDVVEPEPVGGFAGALPLIAGIVTVLLLAVLVVVACLRDRFANSLATYIAVAVVFLASAMTWIISGVSVMVHDMPKYGEQQDSARKLIERTYNLDLDYEQFSDLDYPYGKPTAKFKVFGKTHTTLQTVGTGFREADIYLVWADGKFGLSESSNGKTFEQLPTKS